MRIWLDRLGYFLIIVGTIVYLIRFKELIIYGTDYYINGSKKGIAKIIEKYYTSEKITYLCKLENIRSIAIYTSTPTTQDYQIGSLQNVIISPTFKIILFGRIVLLPYLASITILVFLMIVSAISVKRIFFRVKMITHH
jgi:hypothetical protein